MGLLSVFQGVGVASWLTLLLTAVPLMLIARIVYNLFLHPLSHIPGPLFARASGLVSYYHALRGKRHIWVWQQFQIYGSKIRVAPDTVLFCDPDAYGDIYSMKANVRRSNFYTAWGRSERDRTTLHTVDPAVHAQKRRLLNLSFTEKSLRTAPEYVTKHVDRWNEILVNDAEDDWSDPVDFGESVDTLIFDMMGDLCFGKSFDIKEPGDNPLKSIPSSISKYMYIYNTIARSPFLGLINWLKPRGLQLIFDLLTPADIIRYFYFVDDSVTERLALQAAQASKPEEERRRDLFYYLCEARDPDTGGPAYGEVELRAEANLLIVAGSHTTAVSLAGILFCLTGPDGGGGGRPLRRLTREVRAAFASADDIVPGPRLKACAYLRACIDEGMRLVPSSPSELPRQVLPGGLVVCGEYLPAGTVVGTAGWADSRNHAVYGDAEVFRPERWIADEKEGRDDDDDDDDDYGVDVAVTGEDVARARAYFHPFSSGPGNCIGKNLAMVEMMITLARTLYRFDVRRVPGSTLGGGAPELGWGARDSAQYQLRDAYIALRQGPMVQFRKRVD